MAVTAEDLITRRERAIKLADKIGNVTETCQRFGMSRSQFYVWKKRFDQGGRDGLIDRPPIHHDHPLKKPRSVEERVLGHALANPNLGCHRLAQQLHELFGIDIHGVTVQNILNHNSLGTRHDRIHKVEELVRLGKVNPPTQLIDEVAKLDPKFRELHRIGEYPGDILVQDCAIVGDFPGPGRVYVQVCIDSYSCYAWARLYCEQIPDAAGDLLYQRVRPQFNAWGIKPQTIQTPNNPVFYRKTREGENQHPYRYCLAYMFKYEHQLRAKDEPKHNGLIVNFLNTVRRELFRPVFLAHPEWADDIDRMNAKLADWLDGYNRQPLPGHPAWGRTPENIVKASIG